MKIAVLVKQVPDTATQIQIKPDHSGIVTDGVKYILSPYDEFAVEEALRIKEKIPGTEVVALTVGPERTKEALRNCMAMGVDLAVRIWDETLEPLDQHITTLLLAKKLEQIKPLLIWCGRQAADDDMSYVGGAVAAKLDLPYISIVSHFELQGDNQSAKVTRSVEGGEEILSVTLPCVLSAEKGLNEPRYPSLAGMMKAKKKEIEEVTPSDLGVNVTESIKTEVTQLEAPPVRPPGKMLTGTPEQVVSDLVKALREEAKVI